MPAQIYASLDAHMDESLFPKPLLFTMRRLFAISGRLFPKRIGFKAADLYLTPERHPRPAREQAPVDSGEAIQFNNGMRGFCWNTTGNPQAPTVLLVHGWSGRATQLFAFIQPLCELGYQVIGIDLPAHGESVGSTTNPPHASDSILAAGKELIAAGHTLHTIIAHSFGSACSMWAIHNGLSVGHMISLAAPTHYIHREFAEFFRLPAAAADAFYEEISHRMRFPVHDIRIESIITDDSPMKTTPTLIIHGSNDVEMPVYHAQENRAQLPNSELVILSDCGHRKAVWDPRVVDTVTTWLGMAKQ